MLIIGCGISLAAPAGGQTNDPRAALEAAFQDMLADLANPDKSFRYAELAVQTGEVRGAIAALERLLLLNPNLDNIRLELGVLYYQVGAYDLAQAYLQQAVEAETIPPDVKERAVRYLAEAERRASPHGFSGSVFAGLRYDTNVNLGPTSRDVLVGGVPGTLDPESTEDDDFSTVIAGNFRYVYDLQQQDASRIETNAAVYVQDYLDRNDFDTIVVLGDAGPWLDFGEVWGLPTALRPYITGTYFALEDQSYLVQYGGGLTLRSVLTQVLALELNGQVRGQEFYGSPRRPTASDQEGIEAQTSVALFYTITPNQHARLFGRYIRDDARADFEANDEFQIGGSYTIDLEDPFEVSEGPWSTTLFLSYRRGDYDAPDPTVDPNKTRKDDRYQARLTTVVPVAESFSAVATGEYTNNASNIQNFEYENFAVSLGVLWSF